MKQYWATRHYFVQKGTIIAKVQKTGDQDWAPEKLISFKIINLLFRSGQFEVEDWRKETVATIIEGELKDEKETIKFVFEEVEYSK